MGRYHHGTAGEGVGVSGVEIITAALTAGATAGVTATASTAIQDAYTGLRDLLRRRLSGHATGERALDTPPTEVQGWQDRLGEALTEVGADRDDEVLALARRLLTLTDAERLSGVGVDARGAQDVQIGDGTVRVGTNQGGAVGTFHGPVTIGGSPPVPPAPPGMA